MKRNVIAIVAAILALFVLVQTDEHTEWKISTMR